MRELFRSCNWSDQCMVWTHFSRVW